MLCFNSWVKHFFRVSRSLAAFPGAMALVELSSYLPIFLESEMCGGKGSVVRKETQILALILPSLMVRLEICCGFALGFI